MDDKNFVVRPRQQAARDRAPQKRLEDRNAIAMVDRGKGGSGATTLAAGVYNARSHKTVHRPRRKEAPATEFRVLQDNADKFQHNKGRVKAVQAPSERQGASTLSAATCSGWGPWTP